MGIRLTLMGSNVYPNLNPTMLLIACCRYGSEDGTKLLDITTPLSIVSNSNRCLNPHLSQCIDIESIGNGIGIKSVCLQLCRYTCLKL